MNTLKGLHGAFLDTEIQRYKDVVTPPIGGKNRNVRESKTPKQNDLCTDLFKQAVIQYFNLVRNLNTC